MHFHVTWQVSRMEYFRVEMVREIFYPTWQQLNESHYILPNQIN